MNRKIITTAAALLALICSGFSSGLLAQSVTGRISGAVTDAGGALVPGVTVKITNEATQQPRSATTDSNGFYVVTNLPVGAYTLTIEHQGFKKATKTGYSLVADGRLTVDFALEAGAVTESVEVIASTGETVNSTSGEVARVIDRAQVQELALNGRNYLQLTTLIPGAPLLTDDPVALMTDLGVNQPINGNRGNTNLLTIDGGFNLDSGSNNSQINNIGIDFIQEVKIQTSNFSAEYGRNSGASINVVTRSGGNEFHGSVFEFLRNDKLDANNFFNKARTVEIPRPAFRYNNFGWSFGGPIIKDKFFFFGGMEWKKIRRFTASTGRSIPTRAERNGDFSFRLRGPDGIIGTADDGVLRDTSKPLTTCVGPVFNSATGAITTQAIRTGCFPGNIMPANLITADGRALANIYTAMEGRAVAYTDTPTGNNAVFQEPNPFDVRQDLLRLDYRFSEKHSIYGRYLNDDYVLIAPFGTFIDSDLPTIPTERNRPSPSYQVGHTWTITPTLINEAKINASWNGQRIPPVGDAWKRSTYGLTYQQLFAGGGRFEESIPDVTVTTFAGWEGAAQSLISPTTDIAFSDNLSWVRGSHTLKTGALIIRNRKDQNGRSLYAGNINFNPDGNPNTTRVGFADMLLGNFRTYSEAGIDPTGFFRFSQTEAFVSDSWRFNRKLSLELGLRYAYSSPTYTQANNIVNFAPALYDPARAVTLNRNGTIDTSKGGNRFNGLIIAADGVPQDELGRVPTGRDAAVLLVPTGAPRGLYDPQHVIMPRVGFAYSPTDDNKMAIRGGFGIFYDKPEGNIIFSAVNIPPFTDSAQFENGNLSNIHGGAASAAAPFGEIQTIDPNLELPYTMSYSLSVQRELPWGIFGEVAYVGNQSRHLLRQPDINAPRFEDLRANAALPTAQRASVNFLRPFKGYSTIRMRLSDAVANYNALQLYAAKRKGDLTMTASYTWSKALGDGSGNGDNIQTGDDPFVRQFNYGPVNFDRRHVFVTTYTYHLPFFGKSSGLLKNTLGGWELSGITRWQTGALLTPNGNSSIGTRRADTTGQEIDGPRTTDDWFNKAAFANPSNERRGLAGVGIIEGPGRHLWDFSLRKRFALTEKVGLQFQGDLFNAWNMVNLNNPNIDRNNAAFGTINGAAPGRNIQLGLRLTF
ncbi:MAG TPA: carboxypeptidase regulatory-like domain-containing protein [Blastocatellia bacterium]|nr:carboxypeptidase regulatory-like domain-containing protein [Blastocatellia bacterium]